MIKIPESAVPVFILSKTLNKVNKYLNGVDEILIVNPPKERVWF